MSALHTPGPWSPSAIGLTNDGALPIMADIGADDRKRVATVDCQSRFKRGEGWKSECDERAANARLIAAAPEMLAALVAVRARFQHYRHGPDEDMVMDRVFAAIANATGIQP